MTVEERQEHFKTFLSDKNYSDLDIVRRFLCFGDSYIFENDELKYFELKEKVAQHFDIHPNEVIMIGSGKLGFSIAPKKDWKAFNDESDIDIAIISDKAFCCFWEKLLDFNINIISRSEEEDTLYKEFLQYLFKGWIRPDKFPFKFDGRDKWFNFFNNLKDEIFENGEYDINAGIYKNFRSFELYHKNNIKRLRIKYKEF